MRPIDYIDRAAAQTPEHVFVADPESSYSFAETVKTSSNIAAALYAQGFKPGDSVAVFSPNLASAVMCIIAVYRAGGAWVPVNIRNSTSSNGAYLEYVKTRWLLFHSSVIDAAS